MLAGNLAKKLPSALATAGRGEAWAGETVGAHRAIDSSTRTEGMVDGDPRLWDAARSVSSGHSRARPMPPRPGKRAPGGNLSSRLIHALGSQMSYEHVHRHASGVDDPTVFHHGQRLGDAPEERLIPARRIADADDQMTRRRE